MTSSEPSRRCVVSASDRTDSSTLPLLQVRCQSWREFAESFADDLTSSGMYVAHDGPLPPLQEVVVQLLLPEATEILLRARVVQVIGAIQAASLGKAPGVALELLDLEGERKRQVLQLIEFARWQGASGDPKSSFARTMLELTPSLPPRELALRLSQLPPAQRADSRPALPAAQMRRDSQPQLPGQRPSTPAMPAVSARRDSQPHAPTVRPSTQAMPAVSAHARRPATSTTSLRAPSQVPPAEPSSAGQSLRVERQSTQSLQGPRPGSQSVRSMPAVQPRADSRSLQPQGRDAHARRESGQTLVPGAEAHVRRDSGQTFAQPRDSRGAAPHESQTLPAPTSLAAPSGTTAARPTDQLKLKLVLTNVAHKHYEAALGVTREMLAENPGDPQALRWQSVCEARLALQRGDTSGARRHYEQVLQLDPSHREAREFARVHDRERKLSSLPFGRYFTTKK